MIVVAVEIAMLLLPAKSAPQANIRLFRRQTCQQVPGAKQLQILCRFHDQAFHSCV